MINRLILAICVGVLVGLLPGILFAKDDITVKLNRDGCFLFSQIITEMGREKILMGISKDDQRALIAQLDLNPNFRALALHIVDLVYKFDGKTVEDYQILGFAFDARCVEVDGVLTFPRKTDI